MSVKDVFKSRLRIRALEEEVEKPMNVHRWRMLEVRDVAQLNSIYLQGGLQQKFRKVLHMTTFEPFTLFAPKYLSEITSTEYHLR